MACECEVCTRIRYYREVGVPSDIIDYILDVEMDRDYYKAILDGSWPMAKRLLQEAIDKIEGKV